MSIQSVEMGEITRLGGDPSDGLLFLEYLKIRVKVTATSKDNITVASLHTQGKPIAQIFPLVVFPFRV